MDDLGALHGGADATGWQKRHPNNKARALKTKARRVAQIAREERYDKRRQKIAQRAVDRAKRKETLKAKEARRKARVASIEAQANQRKQRIEVSRNEIERLERNAYLATRRAAGYTTGLAYKDITGQRFGLLVAIKPAPRIHGSRNKAWWMQCDCGSPLKAVRATNLKLGGTRSCGCYGPGELRERWHKPHVARRKKIKARAMEKERNRPLSSKLRKLMLRVGKHIPLDKADVRVLSEARLLAMKDELARGQIKARKTWKTDKYLKLRTAS